MQLLFHRDLLPKVDGIVTRCATLLNICSATVTRWCWWHQRLQRSQSLRRLWLSLAAVSGLKLALPRPAIGQALEEFQPDIMLSTQPFGIGWAYNKVLNIPLVASYHTIISIADWGCWKVNVGIAYIMTVMTMAWCGNDKWKCEIMK